MKKAISFMLAAMLVITAFAIRMPSVSAESNGNCGDSLTWAYDETAHTLTIAGTGTMTDYSQDNRAPWYDHRNEIETVTLGDGVQSVGAYAFYACKGIKTVNFADSVTDIKENAFRNCSGLTSLTVPGTVKTIGDYAFGNSESLSTLKLSNGIGSIGAYAFSGLTALTEVSIPGSVSSIGEYAFAQDIVLKSVDIQSGVKSIGVRAFSNCVKLESVTLPETIESIGDYAFRSCTTLKSVTLPSSITSMGEGAFLGCNALETAVLSDGMKATGIGTFSGCDALKSVTLSNTLEIIDNEAFNGCSALESVKIPASVTTIGQNAFSGCSKLSFTFENASNIKKMGYSDIWKTNSDLTAYIASICGGTFKYSNNDGYDGEDIDLSGYDNSKGDNNGTSTTWINKSAKWTNEEMTEAELRIDFSYIPANVPTDIVFVLDYSGSMMDSVEGVAKFYTLISKVDDISKELLQNSKLGNRIAIVPFSDSFSSHLDFTNSYDEVHNYIFSENPDGDTHYSEGFETAHNLITSRSDTTRDAIVIFVTDGAPNAGFEGVAQANKIKDLGITIAGIVLDTTAESFDKVSGICSEGMTYRADSNEELNSAINKALISSFVSYLIVDKINTNNFAIKDRSLITVVDENGNHYDDTVTVMDDNKEIRWDTAGFAPGINYTLTVPLVLLDNIYGTNISTNDGSAVIIDKSSNDTVNSVDTPEINNVSTYSLTYNANTGSSSDKTEVYNFSSGENVTVKGSIFTNEGYTFSGWNTKADGTGTNYPANSTFIMPGEDMVLYAQWKAASYKVVYNSNNASEGETVQTVTRAANYKDTVTVEKNTFKSNKKDYTFASWNTKADGTGKEFKPGDTFSMPAQNIVLYAQWENKFIGVEFNVIYDGNGGKYDEGNTEKRVQAVYGSDVTVEDNFFERAGYTFKSWNTEPDGSGTTYDVNSVLTVGSSDVKLYAQWEQKAAPKTGAEDNTVWWIVSLATAGIAVAVLALIKKKRA